MDSAHQQAWFGIMPVTDSDEDAVAFHLPEVPCINRTGTAARAVCNLNQGISTHTFT